MLRQVFCFALAALCLVVDQAAAENRVTLGFGRSFANDTLGDGFDRWRTGAYGVSWVRGPEWNGRLPETFGEILEVRGRIDLITPEDIVTPNPNDRRYASALSLGLHTHWARGGWDLRAGLDLVATGPQTGIDEAQSTIHDWLNVDGPSDAVLANQIPNGVHPTLSFEAARTFDLTDRVRVRPFIEAQGGIETLVRFGGDVIFGDFGRESLLIRDPATGMLYEGISSDAPGFSFLVGGDIAHVEHSVFLPTFGVAQLEPTRIRSRLGVNYQRGRFSVFYGASYLHEETEWQRYGQTLGSVRVQYRF